MKLPAACECDIFQWCIWEIKLTARSLRSLKTSAVAKGYGGTSRER